MKNPCRHKVYILVWMASRPGLIVTIDLSSLKRAFQNDDENRGVGVSNVSPHHSNLGAPHLDHHPPHLRIAYNLV